MYLHMCIYIYLNLFYLQFIYLQLYLNTIFKYTHEYT